jgi:hypothetical protein
MKKSSIPEIGATFLFLSLAALIRPNVHFNSIIWFGGASLFFTARWVVNELKD